MSPPTWKRSVTHLHNLNIPYPILNNKHLRCRVQGLPYKPTCTTSTAAETCLQKELQKESKANTKLKQFLCRLQEQQWTSKQPHKKSKRKRLIGRRGGDTAAAAPAPQKKAKETPATNPPAVRHTKFRIVHSKVKN